MTDRILKNRDWASRKTFTSRLPDEKTMVMMGRRWLGKTAKRRTNKKEALEQQKRNESKKMLGRSVSWQDFAHPHKQSWNKVFLAVYRLRPKQTGNPLSHTIDKNRRWKEEWMNEDTFPNRIAGNSNNTSQEHRHKNKNLQNIKRKQLKHETEKGEADRKIRKE